MLAFSTFILKTKKSVKLYQKIFDYFNNLFVSIIFIPYICHETKRKQKIFIFLLDRYTLVRY